MTGVGMNVWLHVGGMFIDEFVDGWVTLLESKGVCYKFKKYETSFEQKLMTARITLSFRCFQYLAVKMELIVQLHNHSDRKY
jgi:hypothetical protein